MAMCLANWSVEYVKYHGRWYSDAIYTYILDAPIIMKSDLIAKSMLNCVVNTHHQNRENDYMGTNYKPGDVLTITPTHQLQTDPTCAEWLDVKVVEVNDSVLMVEPWGLLHAQAGVGQGSLEVKRDGSVVILRRQPRV